MEKCSQRAPKTFTTLVAYIRGAAPCRDSCSHEFHENSRWGRSQLDVHPLHHENNSRSPRSCSCGLLRFCRPVRNNSSPLPPRSRSLPHPCRRKSISWTSLRKPASPPAPHTAATASRSTSSKAPAQALPSLITITTAGPTFFSSTAARFKVSPRARNPPATFITTITTERFTDVTQKAGVALDRLGPRRLRRRLRQRRFHRPVRHLLGPQRAPAQ